MKGFVFTLDALFALLIVGTGISVLIYFSYTSPAPYYVQYSYASSMVSSLAASSLKSITNIPLVSYISQQASASNQTWPMSIRDQYNDGGNSYGPSVLTVEYVFNAQAPIINGTIVANYGNVYFGAGNTIYALNATTGGTDWTQAALTAANAMAVNATLLGSGMLVYATQANIVALNALTGAKVWSTYVPYGSGVAYPDLHDDQVRLYLAGGKLVTYTYDSLHSSSSKISSFYVSNGTLAGASPQYANVIKYMSLTNGQMAVGTFAGSAPKVALLTSILNGSYLAAQIWSASPVCSGSATSGMAAYGNVIAFGCGASANVITLAGSSLAPVPAGSSITGVSIYNGRIVYQASSNVVMLNTSGSEQWVVGIPSAYGTAANNATPVVSSQNVYTLWSNGYLLVQNLSTGAITQNVLLPSYSGSTNPYMALAYGRLFVSIGSNIIAFGSCQVNPNDSVLSAVATLYANMEGSCADYLLSKVQPSSNYSMVVGNSLPQYAAKFNGASSYIEVPDTAQLTLGSTFTFSFWLNKSASQPYAQPSVIGKPNSGQLLIYLHTSGGSSNNQNAVFKYVDSSGITHDGYITSNFPSAAWTYLAATFNGNVLTWYINGNQVDQYIGLNAPSANINTLYLGYGDNYFSGEMANVQIYNASLTNAQVGAIYRGGLLSQPVSYSNLIAWFPLQSDTNGYANSYSPGFPNNVAFVPVAYNSVALQNTYSITSQYVPLPILNYTTGSYKLYNVGIYSWR